MSSGEGDEGFLSRWSRLKRAPTRPVEPALDAVAIPSGELPDGKSLEELVAALPNPLDLVPGQNLSAFMQAWVPADIRSAALRRMWLLDPAVRDYINPALDYAYDYNIPGGAPGFGPMETTSEMVREVAQMFERAVGRDADEQPIVSGNIVAADDSVAGTELPESDDPKASPAGTIDAASVDATATNRTNQSHSEAIRDDNGSAAGDKAPVFDANRPMRPRRHGGALPS